MATPSSISSLTRPIGRRAVHLTIHPQPQNLSQTTSILALLNHRFGPVEYMKSLRHAPAAHARDRDCTILCIFRDSSAAEKAIAASPASILLERPTEQRIHGQQQHKGAPPAEDEKYSVRINWSGFPHRDAIRLGPFHGPFKIDRKSVVQSHLEQRVPLLGLSDVDPTGSRSLPARVLAWQMAAEEKSRLPRLRDLMAATEKS